MRKDNERRQGERDILMLCSEEVAMVRSFCSFPLMEAFHFLRLLLCCLPASVFLLIYTEAAVSSFSHVTIQSMRHFDRCFANR
jgi:hypothetical protein